MKIFSIDDISGLAIFISNSLFMKFLSFKEISSISISIFFLLLDFDRISKSYLYLCSFSLKVTVANFVSLLLYSLT